MIAIQGHRTRGSEVIALLEMLGGKNKRFFNCARQTCIYFIGNDNDISMLYLSLADENFVVFTLEEFETRFPYKVGNKVTYDGWDCTVIGMEWENNTNTILYTVKGIDFSQCTYVEYLQPHKEEKSIPPYMDYDVTAIKAQNTIDKTKFPYEIGTRVSVKSPYIKKLATIVGLSYNSSACMQYEIKFDGEDVVVHYPTDLMTPITAEQPKEMLIGMVKDKNEDWELNTHKDYEIKEVDGKFKLIKKQSKYPKTYAECCEVLGVCADDCFSSGYKCSLLTEFQELIICLDAYWKIAGEEMGLGKPWEPDWTNNYQKKWTINFYQGEVNLTKGPNVHFVLAFPTEEMRNAFYENFKDIIEACKELL